MKTIREILWTIAQIVMLPVFFLGIAIATCALFIADDTPNRNETKSFLDVVERWFKQ